MAWAIQYAASAARDIRHLDPQVQRRVRAAIEELARDPLRGKPLHLTLKGMRSWRTGDYRIVYQVIADQVQIVVVAAGHRREIYARLRDRLR